MRGGGQKGPGSGQKPWDKETYEFPGWTSATAILARGYRVQIPTGPVVGHVLL